MARFHGLGLLCFALLVAAASATQFRVGGEKGWSVPDANAEPYNAWAGRMRFKIGDQLLFVYNNATDSVLIVDPVAYNSCNTAAALNKFIDGNTVFTFDKSGPLFFISGNEANCRANEKLIVVVLAAEHTPAMQPPTTAPAPAPSPEASAPASDAPTASPESPPPAAGVVAASSSNTRGAADGGSITTPAGSGKVQSGASSVVAGIVASLGACIAYAVLAI